MTVSTSLLRAIEGEGLPLKWHLEDPSRPSQLLQMLSASQHRRDALRNEAAACQGAVDTLTNVDPAFVRFLSESALTNFASQEDLEERSEKVVDRFDVLDHRCDLIEEEIRLRDTGAVRRQPIGTTYYADADGGLDSNTGLSTAAAWKTIDKYAEATRAAGDVLICKRGTTATYDDGSTNLLPSSDGTIDNPIIIEADYTGAFGAFPSSTQQYTTTHGSKTLNATATITDIAAGDWVYVSGDDSRLYGYEVSNVTTTILTLYLPFKGTTGSGKTLKIMKAAPVWGTNVLTTYLEFSLTDYWIVRGTKFVSNHSVAPARIDRATGHQFSDCIFDANGGTHKAFTLEGTIGAATLLFEKCRFTNYSEGLRPAASAAFNTRVRDCLFDGLGGGTGIYTTGAERHEVDESEFTGHSSNGDLGGQGSYYDHSVIRGRNLRLNSATEIVAPDALEFGGYLLEDYEGTVDDGRQYTGRCKDSTTPVIQTDTGTVRPTGAPFSVKVNPSTELSTAWEFSRLKILDLPVRTPASATTFDIYFKTNATTDWTADPLATELWIEAYYWGHATNKFRRLLKSTGTLNFTGSTAWQNLSVTFTPSIAGTTYLRVWYGKTLESSKTNTFYVDPKPAVS